MMENVNEFIKNFRERLASPFFFSFLLAWILINWKVTIALLWYSPNFYSSKGELIDYIASNTSNWQSIGLPVISAVLYTGLLRNLISAFVAFTSRWGGNWNLSILKGSRIPMKKFLTYRDLYVRTNKELEKIIEDEKKSIEEFDKQRQKMNSLDSENVSLKKVNGSLINEKSELQRLLNLATENSAVLQRNYDDVVRDSQDQIFLSGTWEFQYDNAFTTLHFKDTYFVRDSVIYRLEGNKTEGLYQIISYFFDGANKRLQLTLKYFPDSVEVNYLNRLNAVVVSFDAVGESEIRAYKRSKYEQVFVHTLQFKDHNLLTGFENMTALISYKRLAES
jgi:hypothetical protein